MEHARGLAFTTDALLFFCLVVGRHRVSMNDLRGLIVRFPGLVETAEASAVLQAASELEDGRAVTEYVSGNTSPDVSTLAVMRAARDIIAGGELPDQYYQYNGGEFTHMDHTEGTQMLLISLLDQAIEQYQR